ncbi:MAG: TIGR00730 family Rossman fold protein [Archangium sp.]|nr:TIGR00730 family Rossman fold protein [Archangium sp.]MDP3570985.1 TIGR00730 family Rossman fold protein [Archangium sp.]
MSIQRVGVFCGSKPGDSPVFLEAAAAFGRALAANKLDLVYGGAHHGLMGAVASAVIEGGGHVIGVVPRGLSRQEFAHPKLSEHHLTDDMYSRKALMAQKADAFIALPGGFGTMDELFDMLTAAQVGLHRKPIGLLDLDGFYAPLLAWISQALARGFIPAGLKELLLVRSDPAELVEALLAHQPPPSDLRWIKD